MYGFGTGKTRKGPKPQFKSQYIWRNKLFQTDIILCVLSNPLRYFGCYQILFITVTQNSEQPFFVVQMMIRQCIKLPQYSANYC